MSTENYPPCTERLAETLALATTTMHHRREEFYAAHKVEDEALSALRQAEYAYDDALDAFTNHAHRGRKQA